MILGNLFYYFKNDELSGDYYSGTIKIRSNSTFYDRLHFILGKLTANDDNQQLIRKYHSYHNEDHYVFEVHVISRDSSVITPHALALIDSIERDTMINNYFFQRFQNTEILKKQNQKAFDIVKADSGKSALNEFLITTLMINEFNLGNNLLNIRREFQVFPFTSSDIKQIHAPIYEKYFKVNLVFFIVGLFIAIAVREFRKTGES